MQGVGRTGGRLESTHVINRAMVEFMPTVRRFSMKFSDGEKLILMMLSDLYKHLEIRGDVDHQLVKSAISGGHHWAIKWEHTGIFHGEEDNKEDVQEVANILDMWEQVECRYGQLSEDDKNKVDSAIHPRGAKFQGFDGNNEVHFGIACCLVNDMGRWAQFKSRDLNSHSRSIDRHRRMLAKYRPRRNTLADNPLNSQELIDILTA